MPRNSCRLSGERGVAIIAALLVLMLMMALTVGFTAVVMSDQRFRSIDRDRTQAFYGAQAGLEKMTADLGALFFANLAPTDAQVQALANTPPVIPGISFANGDGSPAYGIQIKRSARPVSVSSGPYAGLQALVTQYTFDVTSRTLAGGEVHLKRDIQTAAIPVFQFGMFSDVDLSFFAGADFDFGGRVHTNGNLFLASSATLNLTDKVTAVKEVVRPFLSNSATIDMAPAHNGTVNVLKSQGSPGLYRALAPNEGSVVGMPGSAANEPTWTNLSIGTYNANIRSGRTGAKPLNLPLLTVGGTNPDLVRRPPVNEDVSNPTLFAERYFSKVSLRILLSDKASDLTGLPTVTAPAPTSLEPAAYNAAGIDDFHPPVATSGGPAHSTTLASTTTRANTVSGDTIVKVNSFAGFPTPAVFALGSNAVTCTGTSTSSPNGTRFTGCSNVPATTSGASVTYAVNTGYRSAAGTGTIGGFIKIEMQDTARVWHDVTNEVLAHGIAGKSLSIGGCAEPNADAIIRLERVRDNLGTCGTTSSVERQDPLTYMPLSLFDTREGVVRDTSAGTQVYLGGAMHYVMLDVANLSKWFQGTGVYAGESGPNALFDNGYAVYVSDRRNNRNAAGVETGEYGWEDVINPTSAAGSPNDTLDPGEDVNANAVLDTYGKFPNYNGVANTVPPGSQAPLTAAARPDTLLSQAEAQNNRAVLFRRGLKLVNGSLGNIVLPGLTIVAENTVYVEGDYNANQANQFGSPHAATAIIADAVTLLSNSWNDDESYTAPYSPGTRARPAQSYYRFAVIAGKNASFARPTGWASATDFGTDGGAHNFLRMLEGNGQTVNYRGAIATFYYSRQAVGVYKCCTTVYDAPSRVFNFDTDFLDPAKLPPMTPVFRDLNTTTFSQELRPLR